MPRRSIWSARQRAALFDLPTDEAALLRHYTLSDDDIEQIRVRRGGTQPAGLPAPALRLSVRSCPLPESTRFCTHPVGLGPVKIPKFHSVIPTKAEILSKQTTSLLRVVEFVAVAFAAWPQYAARIVSSVGYSLRTTPSEKKPVRQG